MNDDPFSQTDPGAIAIHEQYKALRRAGFRWLEACALVALLINTSNGCTHDRELDQ
jgi:hypothetical protein